MAKSKNDSSGAGCAGVCVLVFIALLIYAGLFLVGCIAELSFLIVLLFMIFTYQYLRAKKPIKGNMSDFWLNEEEKETYYTLKTGYDKYVRETREAYDKKKEEAKEELIKYVQLHDNAKNKLESLYREGKESNITRNKDGQFSSRSNAGKLLNQYIAETNNEIDSYSRDISKTKAILDSRLVFNYPQKQKMEALQEQPVKKWESFKNAYSSYKASRTGFVIFCILIAMITCPVAFPIGTISGQEVFDTYFAPIPDLRDLLLSSPKYSEILANYLSFIFVSPAEFARVCIADTEQVTLAHLAPIVIAVITTISFLISLCRNRDKAVEKMTPKPPHVDLTNYNLY